MKSKIHGFLMKELNNMSKTKLLISLSAVLLLLMPNATFGQAPPLGTTAGFALFTAGGDFTNTGALGSPLGSLTYVTGDVGTNVGAFSAFPPGTLVGQQQVANTASGNAATDVGTAYGALSATTCGTGVIGVTLGSGQVLTPGVYCQGAATTINGTLTLDGQGDPNALFIIKIGAALATGKHSNIALINSASLCNVYWQVDGQFTLGDSSVFRGTLIGNGAIVLLEGSSLLGRGLTQAGAISLHDNVVTLSSSPAAAGTITGTAAVSQGQTGISYSVPAISNATSYIWTLPAGASITAGAATNSITVDFSTSASSGSVTVQGSSGCGTGTVSADFAVTVGSSLPAAAGTITGTAAVCQGQTGLTYSVPVITNATSYIWTLPTGATISAGTSTNSITVDYSSSASSGSITVQGNNGSGTGTVSADFAITVNSAASAAGTITGTATVCQGQTGVTYSVPAITGATSYLWTIPTGGTISAGAGTNTITVNYSNSASSGSITVQGISTCGNGTVSADFVVTVNPSPAGAGTITGTATVCQGQTGVTYSVPVITNATSYIWTLPSGATITTGATTNSIKVDFSTSAASGNLTVQGSSCGTGIVSANFAVLVNPLPAAAGTITGTANVCLGVTGITYSVPVISNATIYNWTVPSGATITAGATTKSITVDFSAIASSGIITVQGGNNCGSGTVSSGFAVTVNPLPAAATGSSSAICMGSSLVLGTSPITGNTYSWMPVTGLSPATIANPDATPAATTTYTLTEIVTSTGCQNVNSVTVTVNTAPGISKGPASKMATEGGSVSFSVAAIGTGISYQWRKGSVNLSNGGNISGANLATLTINPAAISDTASDYNVLVSGVCSPASASVYASLFVCVCSANGIAPVTNGTTTKSLDIYPNPFTSSINVTLTDASHINKWVLKLYTAEGAEVMSEMLAEQVTTLATGHLPAGIYFYRVYDNANVIQSGSLVAQ